MEFKLNYWAIAALIPVWHLSIWLARGLFVVILVKALKGGKKVGKTSVKAE